MQEIVDIEDAYADCPLRDTVSACLCRSGSSEVITASSSTQSLAVSIHQPPRQKPFAQNDQEQNLLSLQEVSEHSSAHSCWLIVHSTVYDVTPFLQCHPATPAPILRKLTKSHDDGKSVEDRTCECQDATQDYYFHSKRGRQIWRSMPVVGQVDRVGRRVLERYRSKHGGVMHWSGGASCLCTVM